MKKLQIGNVTLDNPVILAPMAGVSDLPFRCFAGRWERRWCAWKWSVPKPYIITIKIRTVSWKSIRGSAGFPAAVRLRSPDPCGDSKTDRGTSFFHTGSEYGLPGAEGREQWGRFGTDEGSEAGGADSDGTGKGHQQTVTVKIRKGFDDDHVNAVEIAKIAEACGVAAVAVHGRTRASTTADRQTGISSHR